MNISSMVNRKKTLGFFIYTSEQVLIQFVAWLANIIIVRKTAVEDYGSFVLFQSIARLLCSVVAGWTNAAFFYFGLDELNRTGSVNNTVRYRNMITGISGISTVLLFIILNVPITKYVGGNYKIEFFVWVLLFYVADCLATYYLIQGRNQVSNLVNLLPKVTLVIMALCISLNTKSIIYIYCVSQISALLFLIKINKRDIIYKKDDGFDSKAFFRYSMNEFFGFIGVYIINYCDTYLISFFGKVSDVAIYNVAYALFSALIAIGYSISNYFSKIVSTGLQNHDKAATFKFFYKVRFILMGIIIAGHLLLYVLTPSIMQLLYGNRYDGASNVLKILLLASVFNYAQLFYIIYYNCKLNNKMAQIINICQCLVNVVFDLVFIYFMNSMKGAAWGTVVAYMFACVMLAVIYEKGIYADSKMK